MALIKTGAPSPFWAWFLSLIHQLFEASPVPGPVVSAGDRATSKANGPCTQGAWDLRGGHRGWQHASCPSFTSWVPAEMSEMSGGDSVFWAHSVALMRLWLRDCEYRLSSPVCRARRLVISLTSHLYLHEDLCLFPWYVNEVEVSTTSSASQAHRAKALGMSHLSTTS